MNPTVWRRSLRTVGKAFVIVNSNRRRLLPVVVGMFLLNLALTALLVNLASPAINLDSMLPFYEIDDDSTVPDAVAVAVHDAGAENKFLWKLHLTGELFYMSSLIMAMLWFSKACPLEGRRQRRGREIRAEQQRQGIGRFPLPLTLREWKSLGLIVFTGGVVVVFFTFTLLLAEELEDNVKLFRGLTDFFGSMYVLTIPVSSEEGLYGFSAIERAWTLVGPKFKDIPVLGAVIFLLRVVLEFVYKVTFSRDHKKEEGPPVIREDTAAEIFEFSLVAALLTAILHSFVCSVILALYRECNDPKTRNR